MKAERKSARQILKSATRAEFKRLIFQANLTPSQVNILNLHFRQELSICSIAEILSCAESTIRIKLANAYDKLAKV